MEKQNSFFFLIGFSVSKKGEKFYTWSVNISVRLSIPHKELVVFIDSNDNGSGVFKKINAMGIKTYNVYQEGFDLIFNNMLSNKERSRIIKNISMSNNNTDYGMLVC
jgi:hypothetical protein